MNCLGIPSFNMIKTTETLDESKQANSPSNTYPTTVKKGATVLKATFNGNQVTVTDESVNIGDDVTIYYYEIKN